MRGVNIVLVAALSGCTWVSKGDLDARLPQLDDDGDGVIAADDCDDNNPDRYPGNSDVPYDGVDGDCMNDDDYDQDKDGHVKTIHQGLKTKDVKATGISPGGDCDDDNPDVNPSADDIWYDGVDSDCSGNDDYDQDRDGFASKAEAALYGPTRYIDGSGVLNANDCDDVRDDVNPDADDQPLDGEDSDCSGNDDFDQDGDGHYSDEALFYQPTIYAEDSTGLAVPGDCDDNDPSIYAYFDAANPGAPDSFYDGIDKNCAGDDDYDQDGDGYVQDIHEGLETTPITGSGGLPAGDCNDDPLTNGASAHPGAVEILSDETDHDCDGLSDEVGKNTFRLAPLAEFMDFSGTDPTVYIGVHSLRFGENSTGVQLTVGAEENGINSAGVVYNFSFNAASVFDGIAGSMMMLEGSADGASSYTLSNSLSTWTDEDAHLSVTGAIFHTSDVRTLYMRGTDVARDATIAVGAGPSLSDVGLAEWNPVTGVSMLRDMSGDFHVVGCDPITEVVQHNIATPSSLSLGTVPTTTPTFSENSHLEDFSASMCVLIERDGQMLMLNDHEDTFRAHAIDLGTGDLLLIDEVTAGLPTFEDDLEEAELGGILVPNGVAPEPIFLVVDDFSNNVLIVDNDFQVIQEVNVALEIASLDATFAPDGMLHMVVVDSDGDGWLYEADLDGGIIDTGLKLGTENLQQASIWIDQATGNILQIAATTESSTVVDPLVYGAAYLTPPEAE